MPQSNNVGCEITFHAFKEDSLEVKLRRFGWL